MSKVETKETRTSEQIADELLAKQGLIAEETETKETETPPAPPANSSEVINEDECIRCGACEPTKPSDGKYRYEFSGYYDYESFDDPSNLVEDKGSPLFNKFDLTTGEQVPLWDLNRCFSQLNTFAVYPTRWRLQQTEAQKTAHDNLLRAVAAYGATLPKAVRQSRPKVITSDVALQVIANLSELERIEAAIKQLQALGMQAEVTKLTARYNSLAAKLNNQ